MKTLLSSTAAKSFISRQLSTSGFAHCRRPGSASARWPLSLLCGLGLAIIGAASPQTRGANRVVAWGDNRHGVCDVPSNLQDVVSISSGFDHALALLPDGSVVAWGSNLDGETDVPADLGAVVAVVAGDWVSYALRADGTIRGWGGASGSGYLPVPDSVGHVVALAIGSGSHVLALRRDGTVAAWGGNNFAQQLDVPANLTDVVQVAAGYGYSIALTRQGQVVPWGGRVPFPRHEATRVVAVAAGWMDAFLLQSDGRVVHWGQGTAPDNAPLPEVTEATDLSAGRMTMVARRRDGSIVQWFLASPPTDSIPMPSDLKGVSVIAARGDHVLAIVGSPVVPAPEIRMARTPAGCDLEFPSALGRLYQVQSKSLAADSPWLTRTIRVGTGSDIRCETDASAQASLYRLVIQ